MRIVLVTHQYPPRFNTGTELYAKRLALRYRESFGHDVRVFTFEPSSRTDGPILELCETFDAGIPVARLSKRAGVKPNAALGSYYDVLAGKSFGRYLDAVEPDVVHVFHAAFHGASILEETFLRRVPTVVNLMDYWFLCPTVQFLKVRQETLCEGPEALACLECLAVRDADFQRVERLGADSGIEPVPAATAHPGDGRRLNVPGPYAELCALAARPGFLREILLRADRVVAPSETMRRIFARFGHDPARIELVPYGVDPMPPEVFDRTASDTLRVGYIGSINRPKGPHLLVEAFSSLPGDMTLRLFGDQTMFPAYAEEVFAAARRDARIEVAGALRPSQVPAVLRELDLLVVPSLWHENTPFVVLEARAAGVPVLGANVGGIAEIVDDGRNGRLFAAGDATALQEVLAELLNDRDRVRSMTGQFADVRTLLANARDFDAMYRELVEQTRPVEA